MLKRAEGAVRKAAADVIREAPETQLLIDRYREVLRDAARLRAQLDALARMEDSFPDRLSGCLPPEVLGYGNCLKFRAGQQWAVSDGFEFEQLTAPSVARWREAYDALLRDAEAPLPEVD